MLIDFKGYFNQMLKESPFLVVDVGARGGLKQEWSPLKGCLKAIGFEPDAKEYERLKQNVENVDVSYYNLALYSHKSGIPFYVTKAEGLSSIFSPNFDFLKQFHSSNITGYDLQKKIKLDADALDNIVPLEKRMQVDFVKIDVEGGAFEVLQGAKHMLSEGTVVGLRIESEFNEKYKGQHLFSDVDVFLREFGYELSRITPCSWKRKQGLKTGGGVGQLIHGEFTYFMSVPLFFDKIRKNDQFAFCKLVKYIIFASMYGQFDLAYQLAAQGQEFGILDRSSKQVVLNALKPSQGFIFRIPKLQNRGFLREAVYHLFMLVIGIWLKKKGSFRSLIKL
jgi:FkbM family methyltransferase